VYSDNRKTTYKFPREHNTDIKCVNFQSQKKLYKAGLCVDNDDTQKGKFFVNWAAKPTMCVVTILVAEIKRYLYSDNSYVFVWITRICIGNDNFRLRTVYTYGVY